MKKKLLALALSFAMVLTTVVPAFADTTTPAADTTAPTEAAISTEAQALSELGLLAGDGSGVTPDYLAKGMTRITAASMVLKMMNVYEEATKFEGTDNFPDAASVTWAEGKNIMAYLKAHPEYGFAGVPGGNFDPNADIDQNSVLKVMLENLGYKMGTDFEWKDVATFAAGKGITVVDGAYTVDGLAKNVFTAVQVEKKVADGETATTIAQDMAKRDPKLAEILKKYDMLPVAEGPLQVESVEFLNLGQVKVVFSGVGDKDDLKDAANYDADLDGSQAKVVKATVQEDGQTVILTLGLKDNVSDVSNEIMGAKNGSTRNTITVKSGTGIAEDVDFDKLVAKDSEFPTVASVKLIAPKKVKVTFSEPIYTNDNPFSLKDANGKAISLTKTPDSNRLSYDKDGKFNNEDLSADRCSVTLRTSSALADGEYTLSVNATEKKYAADYAGYKVAAQDVDFTAVTDTAAPTAKVTDVDVDASVKDSPKTIVTIQFDKDMEESNGVPKNLEARLDYNSDSAAKATIKATDEDNEYKFTFDRLSAPGTHSVFLKSKSTSSAVKDSWGNKFEDTELTFDVAINSDKPVVTSVVAQDDDWVVVSFSKNVTGLSYKVKNADGDTVTAVDYKTDSVSEGNKANGATKDKKIYLKLAKKFEGGTYTVELKKAKDTTVYKNEMDAVTESFETKDKVAPYVVSFVKKSSSEVRVVFSEEMNVDTVENKDNWLVKNDNTTIDIKSITAENNGKSAVIKLDKEKLGSTDIAALKFTAAGLKDVAGNVIKSKDGELTVGGTNVTDNVFVYPSKVSITAKNEITVEFDGYNTDGFETGNFTVKVGDVEKALDSIEINNEKVILKLKDDVTVTGYTNAVNGGNIVIGLVTTAASNDDDMKMVEGSITINDTDKSGDLVNLMNGTNEVMDPNDPTKPVQVKLEDKTGPVLMTDAKYVTAVRGENPVVTVTFSEALYVNSVSDEDFAVNGYNIDHIVVKDNQVQLFLKTDSGESFTGTTYVTFKGEVEDLKDREKSTETADTDDVSFTDPS